MLQEKLMLKKQAAIDDKKVVDSIYFEMVDSLSRMTAERCIFEEKENLVKIAKQWSVDFQETIIDDVIEAFITEIGFDVMFQEEKKMEEHKKQYDQACSHVSEQIIDSVMLDSAYTTAFSTVSELLGHKNQEIVDNLVEDGVNEIVQGIILDSVLPEETSSIILNKVTLILTSEAVRE